MDHPAVYAALAAFPFVGTLVATATPDSGIAPYVGGGAGVVAVAGLTEVTRRLLNGRLIPRETRDAEAETAAYIVAAGQREDRAMKVVEESNRLAVQIAYDLKLHNANLASELVDSNERLRSQFADHLAALTRSIEDLRDELRRERRER